MKKGGGDELAEKEMRSQRRRQAGRKGNPDEGRMNGGLRKEKRLGQKDGKMEMRS